MKKTTVVACALAVLLWGSPSAMAQGKGKGKADGGTERREKANQAETGQRADEAKKAVKDAEKGGPAEKTAQKGGQRATEAAGKRAGKDAEKAETAKGKAGGVASESAQKGKGKAQAPESAKAGKGKGKGQEQRGQALQKQLLHEQAKHMERQARLTRIRELAVQKGDAEMIARVDKLIAKEQEVYGRKLKQMQGQMRAGQPLPAGSEQAVPKPVTPTDTAAPEANVPASEAKEEAAGEASQRTEGQEASPQPEGQK